MLFLNCKTINSYSDFAKIAKENAKIINKDVLRAQKERKKRINVWKVKTN